MSEEERPHGSISRRRMLKRIGAAGAVAWVTPVISSLTTPAHAAGTQPAGGCSDCSSVCPQAICGETCGCLPTVEETCFCHEFSACADLTSCASSEDCPPGWACASSCCGVPLCLPPCGQIDGDRRRDQAVSGPMSGPG